MAFLIPVRSVNSMPPKHVRRSATTVMAGVFDQPPNRDVLTSLLNGVGPYKEGERDEELRRIRKREKKELRKRAKAEAKAREKLGEAGQSATPNASTTTIPIVIPPKAGPSSFWAARPAIHIATMQRSVSVTPPPGSSPMHFLSTPSSTPGPSNSSSTSRTSSKRPRTPDDDEDFDVKPGFDSQPRRKRSAAKKGWKGWVEGSPPPSEKLINLDAVPVLRERRTRSGKNFDAIGLGKDGWV